MNQENVHYAFPKPSNSAESSAGSRAPISACSPSRPLAEQDTVDSDHAREPTASNRYVDIVQLLPNIPSNSALSRGTANDANESGSTLVDGLSIGAESQAEDGGAEHDAYARKVARAWDKIQKTERFDPWGPLQYSPVRKDRWGHKIDSWDQLRSAVQKFDNDMCKEWKEDHIDTLLVFAGLFSAVVTAFTVESYQSLMPDSGQQSAALLLRISQQLADSSIGAATPDNFPPSHRDIRVNVLWFLSIVLSLSSALIGILGKQWIREYQRESSKSSKDAIRLRQLRYDALIQWKVSEIISSLPILLETAVILFFAGMADFLWGINVAVAIVATAAIALALLFVFGTTMLAALSYPVIFKKKPGETFRNLSHFPCPYRSPQARAFRTIFSAVLVRLLRAAKLIFEPSSSKWYFADSKETDTWHDIDERILTFPRGGHYGHESSFRWIQNTLVNTAEMMNHLLHAFEPLYLPAITNPESNRCSDHDLVFSILDIPLDKVALIETNCAIELYIRGIYLDMCTKCSPKNRRMRDYYRRIGSITSPLYKVENPGVPKKLLRQGLTAFWKRTMSCTVNDIEDVVVGLYVFGQLLKEDKQSRILLSELVKEIRRKYRQFDFRLLSSFEKTRK